MTTPTLAMAGHAVPPAGGQLAAGGFGSGVGEVIVNAPVESGPVSPGGGRRGAAAGERVQGNRLAPLCGCRAASPVGVVARVPGDVDREARRAFGADRLPVPGSVPAKGAAVRML